MLTEEINHVRFLSNNFNVSAFNCTTAKPVELCSTTHTPEGALKCYSIVKAVMFIYNYYVFKKQCCMENVKLNKCYSFR